MNLYKRTHLLFCCSCIVIFFILKIIINEDIIISLIRSSNSNLRDDEPEEYKDIIRFKSVNMFDNKNEIIRNSSISKLTTENLQNKIGSTDRNFPFDEDCYFKHYPLLKPTSKDDQDFNMLKSKDGKDYKTILAYHYAYGKQFGFGLGHKPFEAACCKEKRCFMTDQRSKIPIEDFDAVLIHFRRFKFENLPKNRKKHQRWIFYEKEPPTLSSKNPEKYERVFNWTMTYRSDSDINARYGEVYSKSQFPSKDLSNISRTYSSLKGNLANKTKMVAWMVSDCNSTSKRELFAKQLQKYIDVDIYGKCGELKCNIKYKDKCYQMIEEKYRFYLSLENSFCTDYVTEKLFNILNYDVIPIVRGSVNYSSIAPPHSYINVQDFKTTEELANYLKYLANNDTAYLEYFKWRDDYISTQHKGGFCDLCFKLHNDSEEKIYYDLKDWFHRKSKCID